MSVSRRNFIQSISVAGAGLALANRSLGEDPVSAKPVKGIDDLNIALIGSGAQGKELIEASKNIPGVRYKAVCDIWDYNRNIAVSRLKAYKHDVNGYEDYKEMLATEKDLDAVIVASPDWMHAEHANACMNAGLHVYSEKEMSNSLEKARSMVETSRKTKKLLQIGHQRRSNPRYIHALDKLVGDMDILGRVTHANAQWNRSKTDDLGWPYSKAMPPEKLEKYGYASMSQFRNWRWYKKYGGGPIVDLGSHQIDLFAWVFGCNPKSVIASGGVDYYHHHEWYDNVLCIYEYEKDGKTGRAFYQTLTTSKHGGNAEAFMGENGTLLISERAALGNSVEREEHAPKWDVLAKKGLLKPMSAPPPKPKKKDIYVDVRASKPLEGWPLPIELVMPAHQPHIQNFCDAIRLGTPLSCPGEIGYETAVAVLAVNEAVRTNQKINFKKEEFHV